jgi:hypothetical protein
MFLSLYVYISFDPFYRNIFVILSFLSAFLPFLPFYSFIFPFSMSVLESDMPWLGLINGSTHDWLAVLCQIYEVKIIYF